MNISVNELAILVDGAVIGDGTIEIGIISPINDIASRSLVFADGEKNVAIAESSAAAAILVSSKITVSTKTLIQVAHPMKAFITLLNFFNPPPVIHPGIHSSAVIGEGVQIGKEVTIGPFVVIESGSSIGDRSILKSHIHIGRHVVIGEQTTIHPHVTVYDNSHIGSRVTIHASTVVGSDGFGYSFYEGKHQKIPHVGRVVIHDDVEIGANTAIDRATMGATVIGEGTKVDNLVQIAHSVTLGKNNILCGFTGIAGSTTSGNNVIFAANVGVSDHVRIDDGVILGARTGVPPNKHLIGGNVYLGSPARPKDLAIQHELAVNRIPLMRKNIKILTEQVALLQQQLTNNAEEKS